MGSSRFDPKTYATYANATAHMSHADYRARTIKDSTDPRHSFNPKTIKVRESVKSDANPHPTPIIVGLDVTGSMGRIVEACRRGLGTLFEETIKRAPVSDPHVLAMAIGDMATDSAPVQATQFEADPVTIGKQVEDLYLERGGGSNDHESYLGPLYFALMRTKCDAFAEGRKGFLFTVGDELPQEVLTKAEIEKWFGDQPRRDYSAADLIAALEPNWHVFHLIAAEGQGVSSTDMDGVHRAWSELLGQRAMMLRDHTKMAEVIISTIEVVQGRDKDAVAASWSGATAVTVREAVAGLVAGGGGAGGSGAVAL